MQPLIIETALNELMDKANNPHVPYGPEEVAEDGARCVEAGASMLHFHARDSRSGEQLWTSAATYAEAMRQLFKRGVAREIVFYPTYLWLDEARLAHVFELRRDREVRLGLAALDVGAVLLNRFDPGTRRFENPEQGKVFTHQVTVDFLERCRAEGLRVYSGCSEPGHLRHLLAYRAMGLLDGRLLLKFFTSEDCPYGLPPGPRAVRTYAELLDELAPDVPRAWFVHCYGAAILPMAAQAILLGGHVRIGLGDETFARLGQPSNAELVGRVVDMARAVGRPIATPAQAREILEIPPYQAL
jgi:3-keto-5-aminohexanoate cleavage enzyme